MRSERRAGRRAELVNEAPYENYIFVLEAAAFDTSNLMDAAAYEAYLGTLEE